MGLEQRRLRRALLGVVFVLFPALKPAGEPLVRIATLSDLTYEKVSWG